MSVSESAADLLINVGESIKDKESGGDDSYLFESIELASENVKHEIEQNTEIDEMAEEIYDSTEDKLSRAELRREFRNQIDMEISRNQKFYHNTIDLTLQEYDKNWSDKLEVNEMIDVCNEVIDVSIDVFINDHFDELAKEYQKHTGRDASVFFIAAAGSISYGIIERIAADAIQEKMAAVTELIQNSAIQPADVMEAIIALFRALLGL